MVSEQGRRIREAIRRERPDPDVSLLQERDAWDAASPDVEAATGVEVAVGSVGGVPGRWLTPLDESRASPIVWCHGGGLTSGSSLTHRAFAARLARATARSVFVPDYRLLPEHSIDAPVADLSSILDELGEPGVVVGGDSSGAALAVSCIACRVRDEQPVPEAIVSLSGAFDATLSGGSFDEGRDPQLDRRALAAWQDIVRGVCDLDDRRLSPLFDDLCGLPPTLLLCGRDEVWRSDSERMARRLSDVGVVVELSVAKAMWHVWPLWGDFPESRAALDRVAVWLNRDRPDGGARRDSPHVE